MRLIWMGVLLASMLNARAQGDPIRRSGDVLLIALPLGATLKSMYGDPNEMGLLQFYQSASSTALITHLLKWSIDKQRPDGDQYSFPSGHTSFTFATAGFLHKRYGWQWGVPSYALASYVGWTRIHAKRHDIYDVLAGAAIGVGCSYAFTRPVDQNLQLAIQPTSRGASFVVNYRF